MKKNVLCVIFAIILCSSCQSSSLEKKYTVPGSVPDTSAKQPDIPETDNFTDYNDLITKTDDIHYIAENFFSSNIYGSGSISDIAGTVGIKCLRETGNGKKTELFFKEHTDDYILYKTDAESQTPYSGEILDIDRIK